MSLSNKTCRLLDVLERERVRAVIVCSRVCVELSMMCDRNYLKSEQSKSCA